MRANCWRGPRILSATANRRHRTKLTVKRSFGNQAPSRPLPKSGCATPAWLTARQRCAIAYSTATCCPRSVTQAGENHVQSSARPVREDGSPGPKWYRYVTEGPRNFYCHYGVRVRTEQNVMAAVEARWQGMRGSDHGSAGDEEQWHGSDDRIDDRHRRHDAASGRSDLRGAQ